jgi:hypothetical protein
VNRNSLWEQYQKMQGLGGDRRAMKLWSWMGAVEHELLNSEPIEIATKLSPEMTDRIIVLGPRIDHWLMAVAKAAKTMNSPDEIAF